MTEEIKTVVEVDCTTGEQTVRAMTTEELADLAITTAQAQERDEALRLERLAFEEARASALAKLTSLGLSEDELKAIVG